MSNGTRKENSKLPVRRENNKLQGFYEQALFDTEMNPSEIMFNSSLAPQTNDSFFSPLGHVTLSSKNEVMESPLSIETPPVDTSAAKRHRIETQVQSQRTGFSGDYASGNFTFTSGQEKTTLPSASKRKRKHPSNGSEEEHDEIKSHLFALLENNSRILAAHVQSQNLNSQLDRDQRKEHASSLVAVLGKLSDALGRIADRL